MPQPHPIRDVEADTIAALRDEHRKAVQAGKHERARSIREALATHDVTLDGVETAAAKPAPERRRTRKGN